LSKHADIEVIPINFRLTSRASEKINRLTRESSSEGRPFVASLLWNEAYDEIKKYLVDRSFVVAWYYLNDIPENAIQHIDGVDLYFAVDKRQSENFRGRTIDYENDRFFFLP